MIQEKTICLRQLFKTSDMRFIGWGDCSCCVPNDDNKKCLGYYPISCIIFYVHRSQPPTITSGGTSGCNGSHGG